MLLTLSSVIMLVQPIFISHCATLVGSEWVSLLLPCPFTAHYQKEAMTKWSILSLTFPPVTTSYSYPPELLAISPTQQAFSYLRAFALTIFSAWKSFLCLFTCLHPLTSLLKCHFIIHIIKWQVLPLNHNGTGTFYPHLFTCFIFLIAFIIT